MQGILELGLSPESPGGTAGDSPLALQAGREPAGAPERPLPIVEIPHATIRPYQSCAIWCPSGERLRAIGEASHVFVELAAAGPGKGVVAKLRPARPDGVPDTVEYTGLFYAAGTQRTVDPETQLSYYSRARRIQPPSAMRAKFDWQQAQVILMELSSYVQAREAHLRSNPCEFDAQTQFPRIDTRRLAAVASAARLRHVGAFIDLVLASFPADADPVTEDSYPFANDPRMLEKLHSIVSTNTSRFAAFRGGPAAAPEADGEEWLLDSGAGWSLGDDSANESRGRNIDDSLMPEEAKQVARPCSEPRTIRSHQSPAGIADLQMNDAEAARPFQGLAGRRNANADWAGGGFSGHSGRADLAAELSGAGASTHEIAAAADWQSASTVIR